VADLFVVTCTSSDKRLGYDLKIENGYPKVVRISPGAGADILSDVAIKEGDYMLAVKYEDAGGSVTDPLRDLEEIGAKIQYLRSSEHEGGFELIMWRGSWTRIPAMANGAYDLTGAETSAETTPSKPKEKFSMPRESNPFFLSLKANEAKTAKAKTRARSKTVPSTSAMKEKPLLSEKHVNIAPPVREKAHSVFAPPQMFAQLEADDDDDELVGLASGL